MRNGHVQVLDNPINLTRLQTLARMLRTCRPMGGRTEKWFRDYYLTNLRDAAVDEHGNIHVIIDKANGDRSRVLWSCHTDTVHRASGAQGIRVSDRTIELDDRRSNCLGADDTIGVWIMREMVIANVPGHYVFHYGEERGGIGSSNLACYSPELIADLDYAIAFDRRGKHDVITHQGGMRTCSDAFAMSLARALRPVSKYRPCSHGIYTDTREYADLIPECTNISVGYDHEHSKAEYVRYWFALALCVQMCAFDESVLICSRNIQEQHAAEARERAERMQWRQFNEQWNDRYYDRFGIDWASDRTYYDSREESEQTIDKFEMAEYRKRYAQRRASKLWNATRWRGSNRIN